MQKLVADFPDNFIFANTSNEDGDPNYIFHDIGLHACWDMGSADGYDIVSNREYLRTTKPHWSLRLPHGL